MAGRRACRRAAELLRLERAHFSDWLAWLTTTAAHVRNRERYAATLQAVDAALAATEACPRSAG
jgi:truncated hemoglobin YjbI